MGLSSSRGEQGLLCNCVLRPLTVVASLVEQQLQGTQDSGVACLCMSPTLAGRLFTTEPPGKPYSEIFGLNVSQLPEIQPITYPFSKEIIDIRKKKFFKNSYTLTLWSGCSICSFLWPVGF